MALARCHEGLGAPAGLERSGTPLSLALDPKPAPGDLGWPLGGTVESPLAGGHPSPAGPSGPAVLRADLTPDEEPEAGSARGCA